jgi:hypothetical protein
MQTDNDNYKLKRLPTWINFSAFNARDRPHLPRIHELSLRVTVNAIGFKDAGHAGARR